MVSMGDSQVQSSKPLIMNTAVPCDENSGNLPNPPPAPPVPHPSDCQDWKPFGSWLEFDFAHYHFVKVQIQQEPLIQRSTCGKHLSWNMERTYHGRMPRTSITPLIWYSLEMHPGKYTRHLTKIHALLAYHQNGWWRHTSFVLVIHDLFYIIN